MFIPACSRYSHWVEPSDWASIHHWDLVWSYWSNASVLPCCEWSSSETSELLLPQLCKFFCSLVLWLSFRRLNWWTYNSTKNIGNERQSWYKNAIDDACKFNDTYLDNVKKIYLSQQLIQWLNSILQMLYYFYLNFLFDYQYEVLIMW